MDDVTDFTAEELEKVWTKYSSYPFDPFVARAVSFRDPFAILSETFREGALLVMPTSDKGSPKRMIESQAADVVAPVLSPWLAWDQASCTWYLWQGTHWQAQTTSGRADALIAHVVHIGCGEIGYRPAYLQGISLLMQRRNLLRLPAFAPGLIPFKNGLLNIATRRLRQATPQHSLDWCLPHEHDAEADCPTIRAWLLRNVEGDDATVELLRAWLAALVRGIPLQKILLLLGRGGTGKSTFARLAMALVGDGNTAISSLRDLEQNRFELAKVFGKRLLLVNEAGRHGASVNQLKSLTGGDPVPLERKHQQQQGSFVFRGLTLLASNEDLITTDATSGLERRRLTVRFPVTATAEERAEWEARGGEPAVLHAEIPGLINWCLALSEQEIRARIDAPPERVVADNLLGMQAGNSVADWLMECCVVNSDAWGQIGHREEYRSGDGKLCFEHAHDWLYSNYLTFCQREGRRNPVALRKFAVTVLDIGETLGHRLTKTRHPRDRYYAIKGLDLRRDSDLTGGIGRNMDARDDDEQPF
jgi:putative DNA primase/helicase